jgi:hypothetical protein
VTDGQIHLTFPRPRHAHRGNPHRGPCGGACGGARAEGRAEDILRILDRRGIEVSEAVRERITTGTDLDILNTWFDRAITVVSAEELFVET